MTWQKTPWAGRTGINSHVSLHKFRVNVLGEAKSGLSSILLHFLSWKEDLDKDVDVSLMGRAESSL